ncbi:hypothetical protein ES705_48968 [subsurface metagenome]
MNKKRTISIRHSQLVRFRNAVREVIFRAELIELEKILEEQKGLEPTESDADMKEMKILSDKWQKLEAAWKKSLCTCPLCGSRTSDMTFNPYVKKWFCVSCYKENHEFYIKSGEFQIFP